MDHPIRTAKQLGAAIGNERVNQGMTQQSLSELTGIGQKTVSHIETGKDGVKLDTIFTLLAALDLQLQLTARSENDIQSIEDIF